MTEERRREILTFEDTHGDMPPEAFFALAEKEGIEPQDFIAAEEEPEE
jgi:hypothetical protein